MNGGNIAKYRNVAGTKSIRQSSIVLSNHLELPVG